MLKLEYVRYVRRNLRFLQYIRFHWQNTILVVLKCAPRASHTAFCNLYRRHWKPFPCEMRKQGIVEIDFFGVLTGSNHTSAAAAAAAAAAATAAAARWSGTTGQFFVCPSPLWYRVIKPVQEKVRVFFVPFVFIHLGILLLGINHPSSLNPKKEILYNFAGSILW